MFGETVTLHDRAAVGSAGYIIKLDIHALLLENVQLIQAQVDTDDTPEPVEGEVAIGVLYGYLNDDAAPDLAYNVAYNIVSIFLKTTAFPYADTTRFNTVGRRYAQNISTGLENLDIPERDLLLLLLYVKRLLNLSKNNKLIDSIETEISSRETAIKNE